MVGLGGNTKVHTFALMTCILGRLSRFSLVVGKRLILGGREVRLSNVDTVDSMIVSL